MIRSEIRTRLGQTVDLETSQGCIEYLDPDTGLYTSDPNSPCVPGSGGAADAEDPGAAAAIAASAAAQAAAADSAALNQNSIPFPADLGAGSFTLALPSASSLFTGSALTSPLPGLGLGSSWLTWVLLAGAAVLVFSSSGSASPARRRRK